MIQDKQQPHAPLFLVGGKENFRSPAAASAHTRWPQQLVSETIQTDGRVRVAAAASKPQAHPVLDKSSMSTGQGVHSCIADRALLYQCSA